MPNNNTEAEQAVLGSLLLSREKYPEVDALLSSSDFESEVHKEIYECIKSIADKGKPIDHITVSKQLDRNNTLQRVGGLDYLKELQSIPVSALAADSYANLVKDQSIDRNLRRVLQQLISLSENPKGKSSDDILNEAEAKIFELSENRTKEDSLKQVKTFVKGVREKLEMLSTLEGDLIGISSGFKVIDNVTKGLKEEELIVIAGRPSMGKTSLAMNIAENVAKNEDGCVAVFSLEMSSESLTSRMLGSMASINQQQFMVGKNLTQRNWEKIYDQSAKLSELEIFIDDSANINPMEIRAKCRRLAKQFRNKGGVKLVVIDYIQLMQMPGKSENRVNELSDISRALKQLAKEIKAPVIILSQLNRMVEQRPNKRPQMSDLRDSGAIEQDADLIFMLYRDYVYKKAEEWKAVTELRLVKHRNGPTKNLLLAFKEELTKFTDLDPQTYKEYQDEYETNRTSD
ncbi:MAG: replicative DNA helicase [Gammaproteobacteria bacterium]|uniref:Replicative DNA helicase n=1 Tax=SAR86 cluster bacterium TaxID=2030880 RepID=A0A520N1H1_9GAMM|nr:replicative DNA helicase [SAR86 cluster bacterium]RZO27321.1 MAG: replicative DNA helicase [SAR86 cluster bacterium]|tara:strand:- start:4951 stop:6327 length:1377 start_codon:yes stop_codon:yes gene_type:complete